MMNPFRRLSIVRIGAAAAMTVLAGTAWAQDDLASGALVPVARRSEHDVPLHWLAWRLPSRTLEVLTRCVTEQAARTLVPTVSGDGARSGTIEPS